MSDFLTNLVRRGAGLDPVAGVPQQPTGFDAAETSQDFAPVAEAAAAEPLHVIQLPVAAAPAAPTPAAERAYEPVLPVAAIQPTAVAPVVQRFVQSAPPMPQTVTVAASPHDDAVAPAVIAHSQDAMAPVAAAHHSDAAPLVASPASLATYSETASSGAIRLEEFVAPSPLPHMAVERRAEPERMTLVAARAATPARHELPAGRPASLERVEQVRLERTEQLLVERQAAAPHAPAAVAPAAPRAAPAAQTSQAAPERTIQVRIGAIEIRPEQTLVPPAPPQPIAATAPPPPGGFESFAALRSYAAWTW